MKLLTKLLRNLKHQEYLTGIPRRFEKILAGHKNLHLLRKQGLLIDDFDILIGATALANDMIMVTNNVAHLSRLDRIIIEDWTAPSKR